MAKLFRACLALLLIAGAGGSLWLFPNEVGMALAFVFMVALIWLLLPPVVE